MVKAKHAQPARRRPHRLLGRRQTHRDELPDLRLRNVETLKANVIGLGLYTESDKVKKTCLLWFDNVVAATSYIGPMAKAK